MCSRSVHRVRTEFVTGMILMRPSFMCGPLVTSNEMRGRRPYRTAIVKVDFREGGQQGGWRLCLQDRCGFCRAQGFWQGGAMMTGELGLFRYLAILMHISTNNLLYRKQLD